MLTVVVVVVTAPDAAAYNIARGVNVLWLGVREGTACCALARAPPSHARACPHGHQHTHATNT